MAKAPTTEAKAYTLDDLAKEVTEKHGAGALRAARALPQFLHIPTGIFTLDMALFGGFPETHTSMLYGWESSGKTTVAMRVAGNAQRKYPHKKVVYIDAEGTFDNAWAIKHGVDIDALMISQPRTGEQAVDIAVAAAGASDTSLIILDSIPALVPVKETERAAEDLGLPGLQARLIGFFLRNVTSAMVDARLKGNTPTLLLINQWRNKITMMGDPRTLPGGNALKFFASTRVEVLNKENIGKDEHDVETVDYNDHSFRIGKNKLGNGIRNGEFTMIRNPSHILGQGFIDDGKTVLTYARKFGIVTGGGSSWRIDGVDQKFSRLQEMVDFLYADPAFYGAFKDKLIGIQREHAGLSATGWYHPE